MKTIREFLISKIRRAEVGDRIAFVELDTPHVDLGAPEGAIESDVGRAEFYGNGFATGDTATRYDEIERISQTPDGDVDVHFDGRTLRIRSSPAGSILVFDTLRWIGRALLKRRLDADSKAR